MRPRTALLPAAALGAAALLLAPLPSSSGFSLIGGSLGVGQRDVRAFDNFQDATAADNTTPDDNFPGWVGAPLAIWKAVVEWGSELHGSGMGDPHQPGDLGSGGANFDAMWAGLASGVGGTNDNIHSALSGGSGGTLAFCETPISNGWRIRYYETWNWDDGPGTIISGMDLQGVATHEYGHALGLGHTSVSGSTMTSSASGNGVSDRSIGPDDIAGVQAIYGVAAAVKPSIDDVDVDVGAGQVTITGVNFHSSTNEVWFTRASTSSTGSQPIVKVLGVSSSAGGTQISLAIPGNAGPGDVMVRAGTGGHTSLSNAWPFDPAGGPAPPVITSLSPSQVDAVSSSASNLLIGGAGFGSLLGVEIGGVPYEFTNASATSITVQTQVFPSAGLLDVTVETLGGTATAQLDVVGNDPPALVNLTPVVLSDDPTELAVGAEAGSTLFLATSGDLIPSVLPGIVSASIGNNFTTLLLLSTEVTDGSTSYSLPIDVPVFTTLWYQAAVLDPLGTLPMDVTNATSVFYL